MTTFRACEIYKDASLRLIAIAFVDFQYSKTSSGCRCYGDIIMDAIIVCSRDETYALDMEAKRVSIEELKQENPALEVMLKSRLLQLNG